MLKPLKYYKTSYISNARRAGHIWSLLDNEFLVLLQASCNYCGVYPAEGVDRVNSDIGYIKDNCVSCCRDCNWAKSAYTLEEFNQQIEVLFETFC